MHNKKRENKKQVVSSIYEGVSRRRISFKVHQSMDLGLVRHLCTAVKEILNFKLVLTARCTGK
jgi:hypothetical protein